MPSADKAERVRISNVTDLPVAQGLLFSHFYLSIWKYYQRDFFHIIVGVPQTMLLHMNGADGDVECKVISPSGSIDDCFITPLGDGEHSVRFIPHEEGIHFLVTR